MIYIKTNLFYIYIYLFISIYTYIHIYDIYIYIYIYIYIIYIHCNNIIYWITKSISEEASQNISTR